MLFWLIPVGLIAFFTGWILYRSLVKKDLYKYSREVSFGFFFIGLWAAIYWFAFN